MISDEAMREAPFVVTYRNYRGEVSTRRILPERVWFGSTEYHQERQWILTAWDVDKGARRDFAFQDVVPADIAREIREECARVADAAADGAEGAEGYLVGSNIAAGIRALGAPNE